MNQDIVDLLYDASDVFDDDEAALYAAIKSIHRQTNIEHIVHHIETHISLENYREAFIKILSFDDKKIELYKHLSRMDFKDTAITMESLAEYFQYNTIDHSNQRRHQEINSLESIMKSCKSLIGLIKTKGGNKRAVDNPNQGSLF